MVEKTTFSLNKKKSLWLPIILMAVGYILLAIFSFYFPHWLKQDELAIGRIFYFVIIMLMLIGVIGLAVIYIFKIHQYNMVVLQWEIERWKSETENKRYKEQMEYTRELRENDREQQQFQNYMRLVELSKEKIKTTEKEVNEKAISDKISTTTEKTTEKELFSPQLLKALLKNQPPKTNS